MTMHIDEKRGGTIFTFLDGLTWYLFHWILIIEVQAQRACSQLVALPKYQTSPYIAVIWPFPTSSIQGRTIFEFAHSALTEIVQTAGAMHDISFRVRTSDSAKQKTDAYVTSAFCKVEVTFMPCSWKATLCLSPGYFKCLGTIHPAVSWSSFFLAKYLYFSLILFPALPALLISLLTSFYTVLTIRWLQHLHPSTLKLSTITYLVCVRQFKGRTPVRFFTFAITFAWRLE